MLSPLLYFLPIIGYILGAFFQYAFHSIYLIISNLVIYKYTDRFDDLYKYHPIRMTSVLISILVENMLGGIIGAIIIIAI